MPPAHARCCWRSAYVLLLAIVALGVPLALEPARPRRRRGALAGRGPGRRPGGRRGRPAGARPGSELGALTRRRRPRAVRGRVIVVDAPAAACSPTAPAARRRARATAAGPRSARRSPARTLASGARHSATLGDDLLATAVPIAAQRPRRPARCGSPRASPRSTAPCGTTIARARCSSAAWCSPSGWSPGPARRAQIARPLRRLERGARRVAGGRPRRARRGARAAPSSARSRAPSTR